MVVPLSGRCGNSLNAKVAKVAKNGLRVNQRRASAASSWRKAETSINAEDAEEQREDAEEKQQQKIERGSA